LFAILLGGCHEATKSSVVSSSDIKTQLLDAQYDSIVSARQQLDDFYSRNVGNINEWSPEIFAHYKLLEDQVNRLYVERNQLIDKITRLNLD